MTAANEKPWRVGRKVGRTIYDATDKLIGMMDTPELAALVTTAVNRYLSRAQPAEAVDEAKEREAFEKFYTGAKRYRSVLGYHSPYAERWDGWMAAIETRARAERPLESLLGEDMQDAKD